VPGDERTLEALSGVPAVLAEGELEPLGLLPGASNATVLVRARRGTDEALGVYKPVRGEAPLWDFPDGTLAHREVAAYELARALGWPDVPPTLLRDGPYGPGAVQAFVELDPRQHFFTLEHERADDFRRIAVFDLVANNADRKSGHCRLGGDGRIWAIDHGVCFAQEDKLRTVIWSFVGEPIPARLLEDLRRAAGELSGGELASRLGALLEPAELEALRRRAARVLEAGVFPEPDPTTRPFPWPPV
jgi:uncharacterized repeat protein (TIGR03843 family)